MLSRLRKSSSGGEVIGIADGDGQHLVLEGQRQRPCRRWPSFRGPAASASGCRPDLLQIDDLEAVLFAQGLQELLFGDEAACHGGLADRLGGVLGLFEDFPQLVLIEETQIDEHLSEAALAAGARFSLPRLFLAESRLGGRSCRFRRLGLGLGPPAWLAAA